MLTLVSNICCPTLLSTDDIYCHFHVLRVTPPSAGFHEKQRDGAKFFLPCGPSDQHPGKNIELPRRSRLPHALLSLLPPAQGLARSQTHGW